MEGDGLMEDSSKAPTDEVVIDHHVLNSNANNATLNMQTFGDADYERRDGGISDSVTVEGTFDGMTVGGDSSVVPMNALIHQDRQFLQVDTICEDGDIYLAAPNGQPLAYMGVSNSAELGVASSSQIQVSHEVNGKDDQSEFPAGILLDHTYEQSGAEKVKDVEIMVPKEITASAHPIRTEIVPSTSTNSSDNQSFKTVTVTLLNENETYPETSYILLVSNDGTEGVDGTPADVISITEHKAPPAATIATSKSLLFAQRAGDTEKGACSFCDYKTTQRHLLHKHIRTHSEERPHKCHLCGNAFKTVGALNNHVNTHSGKRPHSCKECDSAFTTSGELIRHIRYKHTFEKPHKCPHCDYAAVELSKMKRHIRTHTGERPYQCTECSYASPDSYKLKRHMRTHTGEKPYACDMCSLRFTQSNSLKAHRRIHLGSKPVFQCELCPATCGRKTDLRIHMRKLHSQESVPLQCRKCHKTFDNRYNYKLHLRSHDGEHTFACSLCPFATLTESKLIDHLILQHEDHRPYQCTEDNCSESFRFKSLLRRHQILVHSREQLQPLQRRFGCSCGKKFVLESNQLKHQELHAGSTILSSVLPVLQDIEDVDIIGEDLVAEVSEEILASNPELKAKRDAASVSPLNRRYVDMEESMLRQRMKDFEENDNLVMRRVVKEVKGHRVVVMEVGPADMANMSDDETMLSQCQDSQISEGQEFVSGSSITHDAAEILYNLAAEGHLAVETQNQEMSDHQTETELTSSLGSTNEMVGLEMSALPDDVMSEAVEEHQVTEVMHTHAPHQMDLHVDTSGGTSSVLMKCSQLGH